MSYGTKCLWAESPGAGENAFLTDMSAVTAQRLVPSPWLPTCLSWKTEPKEFGGSTQL